MQYKLLKEIKGIDKLKVGDAFSTDGKIGAYNLDFWTIQLLLDNGYIEEVCTCGEPHISDRIEHCYEGKSCFVKDTDKKWEPKESELYYYLYDNLTDILSARFNQDLSRDVNRVRAGNCFETIEEALQASEKIKEFISNGFK